MEDVNLAGNKRNLSKANPPWDQRARCSRKNLAKCKPNPFPPDAGDSGSEFFATFKITKPKAPRRLSEEEPQDAPGSPSGARLAVAGHPDQGSDKDEGLQVTFDLNACIDLCDSSDSPASPASPAAQESSPAGEACVSLGITRRDSGYETSPVASDLFYLPESCRDPSSLLGPPQQPPGLEEAFSQVQKLLSQPPPSGDELEALESTVRDEGTTSPSPKVLPSDHLSMANPSWDQRGHCSRKDLAKSKLKPLPPDAGDNGSEFCSTFKITNNSEALQGSISPASPKSDPSLLPLENPRVTVPREFCASRSLSRTVSPPQAAAVEEEQLWDDSLDGLFDCEEFPDHSIPRVSHPLANGPSEEPVIPKDTAEAALGAPAEEQSLHLFEDEDRGQGSPRSSELRAAPAGTIPGAGGDPGRELSRVSPSQPCRESMGTAGMALEKDEPYSCSQELFSVTFDLGFSIEDSGDESPGESRNADINPKMSRAPGAESCPGESRNADTDPKLSRAPGAESTEGAKTSLSDGSRLEMSPGWDCRRLGTRDMSTPVSFQSRGWNGREGPRAAPAAGPLLESGGSRTAREPPEALPSALLTPTSSKGVHKAARRIPMKAFSNAREQIPEVPPVGQGKGSPWRQSFGRSAMESPPGRTGSLGGTKPCGSRAAAPSSDSEEEIVFQRKNRMKKNVLKSPDGVDDSDLESPVGATRKRRRPRTVSDTSSEDSGDFQRDRSSSRAWHRARAGRAKRGRSSATAKAAGRQFLEEEAELSQLDAEGISSDESDGTEEELSPSLARFLNDEGDPTQALDDTQMRAVYLSSVRSPALGSRYKMVHREFTPAAVFSQIPEQDSAYAEDSFCVGDEEEEAQSGCSEEEEEECVNWELLTSEAGSRNQRLTRRRERLHQARLAQNPPAPGQRKKPSRIIVLSDSSEEEEEELAGSSTSLPSAGPGCRNTDLQAAAEVHSSLKKNHGSSSGSACPTVPNPSSAPAGNSRVPGDPRPSLTGNSRVPGDPRPSLGLSRVPGDPGPSPAGNSPVPVNPGPSPAGNSPVPVAPSPSPAGVSRVPGDPSPSPAGVSRIPGNPGPSPAGVSRVPGDPSPSLGLSRVPGDPSPSPAGVSRVPGDPSRSPCILADSREMSSGPAVLSCLRAVHGLRLHVCGLGSSDYIVSSRLAVDRLLQSELQSPANRGKLGQRLQRLQGLFERVCVIVETDRVRPGETSRPFQRTQHYDGVLSALIQAGIRILFSSCQEETAALLKDLALLEHRKDAALLPTEPEGPRRDILGFYLSIPSLSYGAALNLCHSFSSISAVANSSVPALAAGARLSRPQAEELHRFLRHDFDPQLLPQPLPKGKS